MLSPLWSENWCCDWPVCCGGCGALRASKLVCLTFRLIIAAALFRRDEAGGFDRETGPHCPGAETEGVPANQHSIKAAVDPTGELARCFSRLTNLPNYALDRLSRYEATLWRQAGQILFTLNALDRCKPWDRRRRFHFSSRQQLPVHDPEE